MSVCWRTRRQRPTTRSTKSTRRPRSATCRLRSSRLATLESRACDLIAHCGQNEFYVAPKATRELQARRRDNSRPLFSCVESLDVPRLPEQHQQRRGQLARRCESLSFSVFASESRIDSSVSGCFDPGPPPPPMQQTGFLGGPRGAGGGGRGGGRGGGIRESLTLRRRCER